MRKYAVVAAVLAAAIAVPLSFGSSHREAPLTSIDPTADDTDSYVFTAQDAPGSITMVGNWIPFEDPAGGPNFYSFDPKADYYLNIDNNGDGKVNVRYWFKFKTTVKNKNSFLYASGPVTSVGDPDLNIRQTYRVVRQKLNTKGRITSAKTIGSGLPSPPNNVGPKTTPGYASTAAGAVKGVSGGGKVFAGQRDDPFFVSLGRVFDTINLTGAGTGNIGGGVDDLAGYNVHSIVLQVPEAQVTRDAHAVSGPSAGNAVVGYWVSTERRRLEVTNSSKSGKGGNVQVSRLANPLVNEVVIPLGQKDRFNRTKPDADAKNYGKYVVKPELAAAMNALFPGLINAPENNRTDIVQALLQGIPGLNAFPGKAAQNASDTIHINLGVPPTATENRFGVIAGDNAGFPNGRRLGDDVVDIELRVVAGFLKGNKVPLGDGVDDNDVAFLSQFPYVATPGTGANPSAGFGSKLKLQHPVHAPTPAQP